MKILNKFYFLLLLFRLSLSKSELESETKLGITSSNNIKAITLSNGNVLLIFISENPKCSLMNLFSKNGKSIISNYIIIQSYSSFTELVELINQEQFQYYMIFKDNSGTNKQYFTFFNDKYSSSHEIYLTDKKLIQSSMTELNNSHSVISSPYKNEINNTNKIAIYNQQNESFIEYELDLNSSFTYLFKLENKLYLLYELNKKELKLMQISFKVVYENRIENNSYIIPITPNSSNSETKNNKDYDILYIIDSTGSMSPSLKNVKMYVLEVADKTKSKLSNYNIKYGVIFYHDILSGDGENKKLDFTDDMNTLQTFVNSKNAEGGNGKKAEDWPSAYIIALNDLHWRNGIKTIIHICDYGTHGEGFSEYDDHPENKSMYNITERLCDIENLNIKGLAILDDAKMAFNKMNEICIERRKKNGTVDVEDFSDIVNLVDIKDYDQNNGSANYFVNLLINSTTSIQEKIYVLIPNRDESIKTFKKFITVYKVIKINPEIIGIVYEYSKSLYYMSINICTLLYNIIYLYESNENNFKSEGNKIDIIKHNNDIYIVVITSNTSLHFMKIENNIAKDYYDINETQLYSPILASFDKKLGVFYINKNNEIWLKILKEESNLNEIKIKYKLSISGIILAVICIFLSLFGTIIILISWARKARKKESNQENYITTSTNNSIINNNENRANNNLNNNFGYSRNERGQGVVLS